MTFSISLLYFVFKFVPLLVLALKSIIFSKIFLVIWACGWLIRLSGQLLVSAQVKIQESWESGSALSRESAPSLPAPPPALALK